MDRLAVISTLLSLLCGIHQGTANGGPYKVTTISERPFVHYDSSKSGNDAFTGFIPDILVELKRTRSFTYTLQVVNDGKYGRKSSDSNQWNGMIGELQREVVQMAAAPMTISKERKDVVDFSTPFASTSITIVYVKPEGGKKQKFSTVSELSRQTDVKYGLVQDGVTMNFFKNSSNDIYKKMWSEMTKDKSLLVRTVKDGIDKVRKEKGKYAFIMEANMADYYINKDPCDLVKISEVANEQMYAFAFKKGSDLKQQVDEGLSAMRDSGKLETLRKKWWADECQTTSGSPSPITAVSLSTTALSMFIALIL